MTLAILHILLKANSLLTSDLIVALPIHRVLLEYTGAVNGAK